MNGYAQLKGYEKKLKKVRTEVSKAIEMLSVEHAGADLAEARRLLQEAEVAIKKDDWSQAVSLAEKAQLAARPTTEYLLDRAKSLEGSGSRAYKEDKLSEAIELWQKALEEYGRARELAGERKEEEIVNSMASTMASIERDMEVATRNKANTEMLALVEEANRAADEAKKRYEAGDFDGAKERFESARELYAKSATIAEDFDFDDKPRIREAEAEMGPSIEACLLAKGEALVEKASKEKGSSKEDAFSQTISYLESFTSGTENYEGLKERAYKGLVRGRIEVGTQVMQDAEDLFEKGEYYQAKEGYRKAQDHFGSLSDFAVEHRLEDEKGEIDNLIDDCMANIRACTDSMLQREGVATLIIRKVGDLTRGIRVPVREQRLSEDNVSKFRKEYASISYLASGGFGEVWLAQTREGQIIALKVLREPKKNQDTFFREFQIWERLVHRNIVRLLRPRIDPVPLFEMEYVDGGDLKMLMEKNAPFSPERACRIAFDIARGLEYAHASNVVHGDLKPTNILLTKKGEVKISDWGLGKVATSSSKGIGYTPGYAAPEQLTEKPSPPDKKTDVFQLGVVLNEMLTGDNPFDVDDRAKARQVVPDKPSAHNPEVQPALDELVLRCLDKDREERPKVRELRHAIADYLLEHYRIQVKVSGSDRERLDPKCQLAKMWASQNNHKECIHVLEDLLNYVGAKNLRDSVRSQVAELEYRRKEAMDITDEVLDQIDSLLREIVSE